jgi:hypothetical protein
MSHYLAATLSLLLLAGLALLGLEGFSALNRLQSVEVALAEAGPRLALDGGLSPAAQELIERRIEADGGELGQLQVEGSAPGAPRGREVTVRLTYRQPFGLPLPFLGGERREVKISRSLTVLSGWAP